MQLTGCKYGNAMHNKICITQKFVLEWSLYTVYSLNCTTMVVMIMVVIMTIATELSIADGINAVKAHGRVLCKCR